MQQLTETENTPQQVSLMEEIIARVTQENKNPSERKKETPYYDPFEDMFEEDFDVTDILSESSL